MKVLCANDNGNWKWLHEYGNIFKHVKVEGNIVQKEQTISLLNRYFTYFKVKGTESDLEALKQRCVYTHGLDYKYVQATKGYFSEWFLVGINDGFLFPGFFNVYDYIKESAETKKVEKFFTPIAIKSSDVFQIE